MTPAPVCVFAFHRPEHTRATLAALAKSPLAGETEVTVYLDGPRDDEEAVFVNQVADVVAAQSGFRRLRLERRFNNAGLATAIQEGVSQTMQEHGRAIVVEDDIVTSPAFLNYMNLALDRYVDTPEVWHISGYNEPIKANFGREGAAFWRFMSCWGWASWGDRWEHFERDTAELIAAFSPEDINRFNLDGAQNFWEQVLANDRGEIKTWAVFWYATIFRNAGLCLAPHHSYVENIGFDGTGTHCSSRDGFEQKELNMDMNPPLPDVVAEDKDALSRLQSFYIYRPRGLAKLRHKWLKTVRKLRGT